VNQKKGGVGGKGATEMSSGGREYKRSGGGGTVEDELGVDGGKRRSAGGNRVTTDGEWIRQLEGVIERGGRSTRRRL